MAGGGAVAGGGDWAGNGRRGSGGAEPSDGRSAALGSGRDGDGMEGSLTWIPVLS